MARFKVGDRVERVGLLVPEYMKIGRVVRVIPHPQLPEHFTEYEINFGTRVASFYETQLRSARPLRTKFAQSP
jgi:hypothetical protein